MVSSTAGTVNNTTKAISGIPTGTNVTLTTTLNSCTTTLVVNSPSCQCPIALVNAISNEVTCFGEANGSILLNLDQSDTSYTVTWNDISDVKNQFVRTGLKPGTYSVNVQNKKCKLTTSFDISEPSALMINESHVQPNCQTQNGEIELSISGGYAPYFISWNDTFGLKSTNRRDNLNPGFYSVKVTDSLGCASTKLIPIVSDHADNAKVQTENASCKADATGSIVLSFQSKSIPKSIVWNDFNGSGQTMRSGLLPVYYSAIITDSAGCASIVDSIFIGSDPQIQLTQIAIKPPMCRGQEDGSISVTTNQGDKPLNFHWSNGSHTKDVNHLQAGAYVLKISDHKNCSLDTVFIIPEGNSLFGAPVRLADSVITCKNQDVSIQLPDTLHYEWHGPDNFKSFSNKVTLKKAGLYSIRIENNAGCFQYDSINIKESAESYKASFIIPSEGLINEPIIASEISWPVPDSMRWEYASPQASLVGQEQNQYHFKFTSTGTYAIKITAYKYGCSSELVKTITIVSDSSHLTRPDPKPTAQNIKSVLLFPNPNTGVFTVAIDLITKADIQLRIYDLAGNVRYSRLSQGLSSYIESLNLNDVPNGVYAVVVTQGVESQVIHFIISR